ncbi:MAG: polymer-forming cytoskeletal protein [Methylophilaceae bacterium]|jgi:cytoskeletal protein CcmA (bactofilin family)|nr:polymer-forming cytoskeletal protein [Methylophilaceae bacterium]
MIKKKRKFVAITTLIDKDILISGDTTYTGGIRVDGKINGNLKVHGEEGSLLIMGHGSKITGDVEVEKAIINGEINGNVKCRDYLELNTNAIVNGSIEYDIIEVHEGSKINGILKYIKNKKKIKTKKKIKQNIKINIKKLFTIK